MTDEQIQAWLQCGLHQVLLRNFVALAAATRKAQKEYFQHRGNDRLAEARRLETELDRAVKTLTAGESGPTQSSLFEEPPGGENRDRY